MWESKNKTAYQARILPNLQANGLSFYSFMNIDRTHDIPVSEIKYFDAQHSNRIEYHVCHGTP